MHVAGGSVDAVKSGVVESCDELTLLIDVVNPNGSHEGWRIGYREQGVRVRAAERGAVVTQSHLCVVPLHDYFRPRTPR